MTAADVATKQDLKDVEASLGQRLDSVELTLAKVLQEVQSLGTRLSAPALLYSASASENGHGSGEEDVENFSSARTSPRPARGSFLPAHVGALQREGKYLARELEVTKDLVDDLRSSDVLDDSDAESLGAKCKASDRRRHLVMRLQSKSSDTFEKGFIPVLSKHQQHVAEKLRRSMTEYQRGPQCFECLYCQLVRQVEPAHVGEAFHSSGKVDVKVHEFLRCKTVLAHVRWGVVRSLLADRVWNEELHGILVDVVNDKNSQLAEELDAESGRWLHEMACACRASPSQSALCGDAKVEKWLASGSPHPAGNAVGSRRAPAISLPTTSPCPAPLSSSAKNANQNRQATTRDDTVEKEQGQDSTYPCQMQHGDNAVTSDVITRGSTDVIGDLTQEHGLPTLKDSDESCNDTLEVKGRELATNVTLLSTGRTLGSVTKRVDSNPLPGAQPPPQDRPTDPAASDVTQESQDVGHMDVAQETDLDSIVIRVDDEHTEETSLYTPVTPIVGQVAGPDRSGARPPTTLMEPGQTTVLSGSTDEVSPTSSTPSSSCTLTPESDPAGESAARRVVRDSTAATSDKETTLGSDAAECKRASWELHADEENQETSEGKRDVACNVSEAGEGDGKDNDDGDEFEILEHFSRRSSSADSSCHFHDVQVDSEAAGPTHEGDGQGNESDASTSDADMNIHGPSEEEGRTFHQDEVCEIAEKEISSPSSPLETADAAPAVEEPLQTQADDDERAGCDGTEAASDVARQAEPDLASNVDMVKSFHSNDNMFNEDDIP